MPSDTMMKEVVDYYDRHGNANERMRAHYLLGCVYRDMGEAPMALECYQQATEQADTTRADCDFYRLSTIFYQRAELLRRQVLYSQELEELRHSERFAMLAGDTIAAIDRHFYQGMAYLHLKDTIKAIQLIKMAASQFRNAGKEKSATQCMGGVILPYINRRQYHLAQLAIDEYEKNSGCVIDGRVVKGREIFYYMKGMYYLGLHQIDSALFYFNQEMTDASDYNNRIAAYRGLSLSYQQKGIPDSSAKYSILAYNLNDSAYTLETASLTARMKSMYDYAGYQKQAYQKEQEKNLFFRWLIIALSVIALCFGVIWREIIIYKKKRKENIDLRKRIAKNEELINTTREELSFLRELKDASGQEKKTLQQENTRLLDVIGNKEKTLARLYSLNSYYKSLLNPKHILTRGNEFSAAQVVKEFKRYVLHPKERPTDDDWTRLFLYIDYKLPNFHGIISINGNLTTEQYKLCYHLRAGFTHKEIKALIPEGMSNVTMACKNLHMKILGKEGSAKDFNIFLVNI